MNPNQDINGIGNEFLSLADLEIKQSQELWAEELKKVTERLKYEYTLRGQYNKQLHQIELKQDATRAKLAQTNDIKQQKALQKLIEKNDKARSKLQKKESEIELKEKDKKSRQLQQAEHKARMEMLEDEAELYGKSLGNSVKQALEKEKQRVSTAGGFGKALLGDLGKAGAAALKSGIEAGTKSIEDAMNLFQGKASSINTRLQGTSKTFRQINDLFESNLGASPYVQYKDSIDNLASLVDAGIAYNVEQRAFLNTISDKIATTFDTANATLFKIIRIQQEDSTIYRLGAEAELTRFFNQKFKDTSYMSDVYDTVSQSIADSVAQLGTAGGAEYEYQMQKWLGSLYSAGMSSNTLTDLASAVNMLSTGDVQGLSGSNLQNLLVMASNKGNLSYADLLTKGVNASNLNVLMSNIVSLWSELGTTQNQVVRKQYADLFGMDMSDMVAIGNINQSMMNSIIGNKFSYSDANKVIQQQLNQVADRMHISELIQNAYQNVLTGIGTSVASSPGLASTFLINNLIKEATGGINIPFVTAFGTGIDLNTDLNSLINLGIVGAGTLGQIGNVISSLSNKGGLNLSSWGASQYNSTGGTGVSGVVSGVKATTSGTVFVGNTKSSDIFDSSLNAAYDNVDKSIAGTATEEADKMKKAIEESIDPNIQAILELLRSVTNGSALRVQVQDYGLSSSF